MKLQINHFIVDTKERTVCDKGKTYSIRPKTLKLLLYFVEHANTVISKEALLAQVWDDVIVDEGVIFQSISEIRKLFPEIKSIVNHPRKGYEFVAEVTTINEKSGWQWHSHKLRVAASALVLSVMSISWIFLYSSDDMQQVEMQNRVLILPTQDRVEYEDNKWLVLGGMDHLISVLQDATPQVNVYATTEVLEIINHLNLDFGTALTDVHKLFDISGATHIVETAFIGESRDYKVAVTIHQRTHIHQKTLLVKTLDEGLRKVADEIALYTHTDPLKFNQVPKSEFKSSLFTEAMLAYESDWQRAISFLQSYLAIEPNSVKATQYLAKLYIWQQQTQSANALLARLEALTDAQSEHRAVVHFYRGILARQAKDPQLAITEFNRAKILLVRPTSLLLTARIEDAMAGALVEQKKYNEAMSHFNTALNYYTNINNVVGIYSVKLQMSQALSLSGQHQLGAILFNDAKSAIERLNIDFLNGVLQQKAYLFEEHDKKTITNKNNDLIGL